MARPVTDDAGFAAALAERPEEVARACRAALKALEGNGDVRDADRALRAIAEAFAVVAGRPSHRRLDVVVTSRINRAPAACDAPNCAGHRVRA